MRAESENRLPEEFEHLRNDLFPIYDRWPWWDPASDDGITAAYPVDMFEEDSKIVVNAELPGFKKDEIDISVENGMLRISAERKEEKPKGRKRVHERRYERVERMLSLPTGVAQEKAVAKLDDGVLRLELPKSEASESHRIQVS
jgi:HSP20 family protein